MNGELGERIKELRLAKGWTLKDFSAKTDLSVGFLSMVERGRSSATLVSLKKIADALDESMATLFPNERIELEPGVGNGVGITRSYEKNIRTINAGQIYNQLGISNSGFRMEVMEITLLPGMKRDEVIQFSHEGEEITYVLEGVLSMFVEDVEYLMYPGDCYHAFGSVRHNFVNLSNNNVRVLYVLTPPIWNKVDHSRPEAPQKSL